MALIMKQIEKLDTLMFGLYARFKDGKQNGALEELVGNLQIPINGSEEVRLLADRLSDDGYIKIISRNKQFVFASITSRGIEYCEEDSYTYKSKPIFISESSPVMQVLTELTFAVRALAEGTEEQLDELIDFAKSQRRPQYPIIMDIITTAGAVPGLIEMTEKLTNELEKL